MRRVVVTGIGIVSPLGIGSRAHWEALLAGTVGIRKLRNLQFNAFPCQLGGEVPEYRIGDFVPKTYRKATKVMARDTELAIVAADDAFKDSGLVSHAYAPTPNFDGGRFGCNIGAGLINAELNELTAAMTTARRDDEQNHIDLAKWGRDGMTQLTPLWLLKYLPNMPACHVTIIHQLKGPSNTITCADASSHLAIGEAFRTIQRGKADLAICGGAESKINQMGMLRQTLLKRLNESSNDAPEHAVRPFDNDARGTVLGEGGGLLILEEYERAGDATPRFMPSWLASPRRRIRTAWISRSRRVTVMAKRSATRWPMPNCRPTTSICWSRRASAFHRIIALRFPAWQRPWALDCNQSHSRRSKHKRAAWPRAAASMPPPPSWPFITARFPPRSTRANSHMG